MEMQEQVNETVVEETQEVASEATAEEATTDQSTEAEAAPVESDDAAFLAGFNAATGKEGETPQPKQQPEPPAKELIAGMTEDQVKELLHKATEVDKLREQQSKVFGTLGAMRQAIEQLRQRPTPQAVQVTQEKLKRLSEAFPEMAKLLAEDLSEALQGGVPATPGVDPLQFEQLVESKLQQRLEAEKRQLEAKVLSAMHPDWRQVAQSPDFQQWKSGLEPEVLAQLDQSWDAEFIGQKLSEFKAWKAKQAQSQQTKVKRLEAAVTPKSNPKPPVMTDDDAFMAGFNSVRRAV